MPTSCEVHISPVLSAIKQLVGFNTIDRPELLDVGVGTGKWGVLMREYFAVWGRSSSSLRETYSRVFLQGVEVCGEYENPAWGVYNNIAVTKVQDFLERDSRTWDGITCMDVIEHMTEAESEQVFKELARRTRRFFALSFPDDADPEALSQDSSCGNIHEAHQSLWSPTRCHQLAPDLQWYEVFPKRAVVGVRPA